MNMAKILTWARQNERIKDGLVLCECCDNPALRSVALKMSWVGCGACYFGEASAVNLKDVIPMNLPKKVVSGDLKEGRMMDQKDMTTEDFRSKLDHRTIFERCAQLEAENAELRADKARLDWLEAIGFSTNQLPTGGRRAFVGRSYSPHWMDGSIYKFRIF